MKHALIPTLSVLTLAATTACSEAASEPTAVDTAGLVATATDWTPSDLTRDLPVDEQTRRQIEAGVQALHASMVELHARHENVEALEGEARAAYVAELKADMQEIHEEHSALWESLDPAVRETLAARFHEQMREHQGGTMKAVHDRMRQLHGGAGGVDDTGH
jgi:hypothetical protein